MSIIYRPTTDRWQHTPNRYRRPARNSATM